MDENSFRLPILIEHETWVFGFGPAVSILESSTFGYDVVDAAEPPGSVCDLPT